MFEGLTDRLSGTFDRIRGKGIIRDSDLAETLGEIRRALLEADVALPVVKDFIAEIQTQASGEEVVKSVSAGQTIITGTISHSTGRSSHIVNTAAITVHRQAVTVPSGPSRPATSEET